MQVLEENMGEFIFSLGVEKGCVTMTHKPEAKKGKKVDFLKFAWQKSKINIYGSILIRKTE